LFQEVCGVARSAPLQQSAAVLAELLVSAFKWVPGALAGVGAAILELLDRCDGDK
jgi:hypothetical protein